MSNLTPNQQFLAAGIMPFVKKDFPFVSEKTPVKDIVNRMLAGESTLYVTDDKNALSGVITPLDLKKLTDANPPKTADELSNKDPVGIVKDAEVWQLLKIMNGQNRHQWSIDVIPVVDSKDNKQIVGVVRRDDLRKQMGGMSSFE